MSASTNPSAPASTRHRPIPGPARPYAFPAFERARLENDLSVLVAPVTKLPLVTVTALIEAGCVCDPPGRYGLAQLTARLLLEGTTVSDGADLAERFEHLGASVEAHADWDVAAITMTVMSDQLTAAFEIFAEMLHLPAFPTREVARLKDERQAELLQIRAEPRGLAEEVFLRHVYEPTSRFAHPEGGDDTSVGAITRHDVTEFYATRAVPESTTLIFAGDIAPEAAFRLVRRNFGDWSGPSPSRASTGDAPASGSRAVIIAPKAGAPQSELRIGHVGLPRSHPDYFAVVVMNSVLGGLFNSRINLNLREAHAYTYGAFSSFDWRRQAGPFVVSTAVRTDATPAAIREVFSEIDRIRAEAIGDDELSLATSYLSGVFPIRFETTAAIAAALSSLVVYRLPSEYFDTYRNRVMAVTAADVLAAAQTHLHPERMQTVAVGDPSEIRAPLEALGFGPVVEDNGAAAHARLGTISPPVA